MVIPCCQQFVVLCKHVARLLVHVRLSLMLLLCLVLQDVMQFLASRTLSKILPNKTQCNDVFFMERLDAGSIGDKGFVRKFQSALADKPITMQ